MTDLQNKALALIKKKGGSLREIGEKCGVSYTTIRNLIKGEYCSNVNTLEKIIKAYEKDDAADK